LKTTNKFGRLKSGVPDIDENFLGSKHVLKDYLKVHFKPSRKNKDFVFLVVPILPVWVKISHLIQVTLVVGMCTQNTNCTELFSQLNLPSEPHPQEQ
jgi:hypothetical protein